MDDCTHIQGMDQRLGQKAASEREKILLLVDNMSGHTIDHLSLTHIELYFLPPNTTSRLQPLDAGIIECFKRRYRKLFLRWRIERMEEGADAKNIDLLQVTRFLIEAHENIVNEVIKNCWKTTKILSAFDELAKVQTELVSLEEDIALLNLPDAMSDKEYASVTGEEQITASDDILGIVLSVEANETVDEDVSQETPRIKHNEAMRALVLFKTYLEQREEDCTREMKMIREVTQSVEQMSMRVRQQSKITDFFSSHHKDI